MKHIQKFILMTVCSLAFASIPALASDTCGKTHELALLHCAAHEQSLSPEALSIVSSQTKERVVGAEKSKLENLLNRCLKSQDQCANTCDEEMESASIEGGDVAVPLENLSDCRKGKVSTQVRAMNKKIADLARMINVPNGRAGSMQSADNGD